jgi:universal stress protein E
MQIDKLLVVYDPTTETQPALERAAVAAQAGSETIHLFACIYSYLSKSGDESGEVERLIAMQEDKLNQAVARLTDIGIEVTTEVEWRQDWYQAVLDAAGRGGADVVIKSSHKHTPGHRRLKKTSDWTLIRNCPLPILLVKEKETSQARKVLAAIDIRSHEDSYKKLNQTIFDFCQRFADSDDAEVHFVSAYEDLASRPDRGSFLRACGVEGDKVHIKMGKPAKAIVKRARKMDANLVVIGNSARSGLAALANTNTVEKVLDKLDCDLLCVP